MSLPAGCSTWHMADLHFRTESHVCERFGGRQVQEPAEDPAGHHHISFSKPSCVISGYHTVVDVQVAQKVAL